MREIAILAPDGVRLMMTSGVCGDGGGATD